MMKKYILIMLLAVLPATVFASGGGVQLDTAPIDIHDKASIKRGAGYFADYCMGCHSAKYMRFNRIAKDADMTNAEVRELMIFTRDEKSAPTKVGEQIKVSMTENFARNAFGGPVPDLSLTARSRGADWLYTYLRSFYLDPYRPTGMNNLVFPDVGMPNILWELQGLQKAVYRTEVHDGVEVEKIGKLEVVQAGFMSAEEYDEFVTDLVNFMVYLAEPAQVERKSLGWKVLLFLAVFFVFAYLLKKEYWKDIH